MTQSKNKPSPAKSLISRHKPKKTRKKTIEGYYFDGKKLKILYEKRRKNNHYLFFYFLYMGLYNL